MDSIHFVFDCQLDYALDIEVRLDWSPACPDQIGLICFEAMKAEAIFLRENRNGFQFQLVGGTENSYGNFASIKGKQFFHSLCDGRLRRTELFQDAHVPTSSYKPGTEMRRANGNEKIFDPGRLPFGSYAPE